MSNEEILNQRWSKTDTTLKEYLKHFNDLGKDTIDDLIDMFDSLDITYNDLNKSISKAEKRRLDRKIKEWSKKGLLTGYFSYLIASKTKITYADLLEILIYSIYVNQEHKIKELSKEIFILVANDIYSQAINELPKKPKKEFSLTWEFIYSLLWIPTYNKSWDNYLQLLTLTNEQEMYKQVVVALQQEKELTETYLKDTIKKQTNRIISINDDKYSGVLSDTCRQLANKVYIEPFKEDKKLQVRFIAEMDNKTTKMCESMNNMLFYVNDWNRFYRYSDTDKRDVLYTCKGLEQGVNLPPINNHFHWCRSTITYLIDKFIKTKENIFIDNFFIDDKGIMHPIDGKERLDTIDLNSKEYKIAVELKNKYDFDIHMVPRIETEKGYKGKVAISTPDFLINNEKWDYKDITGSGVRTIEDAIKKKEKQAHNFILDMSRSPMNDDEIKRQYNKIFTSKSTNFVDKVIVLKNNEIYITNIKI